MRLMFHLLGEPGHHLPSFPLARALQARGHEIVYLAIRDMQHSIESRGFGYVPVHEDIWPPGTLAAHDQLSREELEHASMVRRSRMQDEPMRALAERRIRDIDPDIALVDNFARDMVLLVHSLGVPCLRISTSLSVLADELPPITSSLAPDANHFQLELERHQLPTCMSSPAALAALSFQVARFGYPPHEVGVRSSLVPDVSRYPMVVLCEEPFDLPRRGARPLYCAHRPELDRAESVDPALRDFAGDHSIILVSLGTHAAKYRHSDGVYRAIADTMRAHPEWRAVVAASERFSSQGCLMDPPGNLLVRRHVPQLWLLRRSKVFVTHAGLGSVREAIALRVPMIAIPQGFDQPGNAVRVAHHGIGVHLQPEAATRPRLEAALAGMFDEASRFRARIAELDAACQRSVEQTDAVAMVEAAARQGPPKRTAAPQGPPKRTAAPRAAGPMPTSELPRLGWAFVDETGRLAEGGTLRAGSALAVEADRPPGAKIAGWVVCPSIGDALARAVGPVAARLRVDGPAAIDGPYVAARALRCLWTVNLADELLAYTDWCTAQALERERAADAETFAAFEDGVARLRALAARGALEPELSAVRRSFRDRFSRLWHRGYTTAHTLPKPHDAARFARWHMANQLALEAASALVPAGAGAGAFLSAHAIATARADAELLQRARSCARAAGIDVDSCEVSPVAPAGDQ
jgi:zeaxanthin glucosyltransferase